MREFGQYRIEALIGRGGMGEVYRAYDSRRDREVALKLLPSVLSEDTEYQRRFRRESYTVARLREPHVIPIHDFGEIDDQLFIDMRLVDGRSLAAVLAEEGAPAPERAVRLISQVAEALDAAHADGVVHRDVKPSNVLVTATDFVYVVDFGIAHAIGGTRSHLTVSGVTLGTLDYMAPERFENRPVDRRTDVYSLACVLFECITGVKPYPGSDLPALMYGHLFGAVPQPSTVHPAVPPAFDAVVARGMAKNPDERFGTAGELAAAARTALGAGALAPVGVGTVGVGAVGVGAVGVGAVGAVGAGALVATGAGDGTPVGAGAPAAAGAGDGGPTVARGVPEGAEEPTVAAGMALGPAPGGSPPGGPGSTPPPGWPPPGWPPPGWPPPGSGTPPPGRPPQTDWPTVSVPLPRPAGPPQTAPQTAPPRGRRALITALVAVLVAAVAVLATLVVVNRTQTSAAGSAPLAGAPLAPVKELPAPGQKPAVANSVPRPTVGTTVPVGPTPGYMEIAPDGRTALIANRAAGVLTVFDTVRNEALGTIPVPDGGPQFVAFSPDGARAYISVFNTDRTVNEVAVLDTATRTFLGRVPTGVRPFALDVTPDGKTVYVPNHDSGSITVIDTATISVRREIKVSPNPHWLDVSDDGTRVYAANHESNVVSVIDTATDAVLATVPVGLSPHSIVTHPKKAIVINVNYDASTVSVIDRSTNAVLATVPTGSHPQDVTLSPDGKHAYLATVDENAIQVLDTTTFQITATVPTGRSPTSVAVAPDGRHAYVTNLNDGTVTVLNIAGTA